MWLSFSPVSAGVAIPWPNSRFNVPEALAVLLPVASAFHWNVWFTAVLVPLLNDEATKFSACEFLPPVAVAVPVAGKLNVPRAVVVP